MASFDRDQTTFTLNILSNIGQCLQGTVLELERRVQAELPKRLSEAADRIGDWSVVWGPGVVSLPGSDRADNTVYVARNDEGSVPVLTMAIAGTNPYSALDWIVEDGLVATQVGWAFDGAPAGRKISLGTFVGLSSIQSLKPGPEITGAGTTLLDFLEGQTGAPVELRVTGHSLGGALSPVVALWLSDSRALWDPEGNASFYVFPTAGPTPGNAAFAAYYDGELGSATTRVHNSIDVVPHGWAASDLKEIPGLYAPAIPESPLTADLVGLAMDASAEGDYAQILQGADALPGEVERSKIDPGGSDFRNFLVQLGYQHVDEYFRLLDVGSILPFVDCVKKAARFAAEAADLEKRLQATAAIRGE